MKISPKSQNQEIRCDLVILLTKRKGEKKKKKERGASLTVSAYKVKLCQHPNLEEQEEIDILIMID